MIAYMRPMLTYTRPNPSLEMEAGHGRLCPGEIVAGCWLPVEAETASLRGKPMLKSTKHPRISGQHKLIFFVLKIKMQSRMCVDTRLYLVIVGEA